MSINSRVGAERYRNLDFDGRVAIACRRLLDMLWVVLSEDIAVGDGKSQTQHRWRKQSASASRSSLPSYGWKGFAQKAPLRESFLCKI